MKKLKKEHFLFSSHIFICKIFKVLDMHNFMFVTTCGHIYCSVCMHTMVPAGPNDATFTTTFTCAMCRVNLFYHPQAIRVCKPNYGIGLTVVNDIRKDLAYWNRVNNLLNLNIVLPWSENDLHIWDDGPHWNFRHRNYWGRNPRVNDFCCSKCGSVCINC